MNLSSQITQRLDQLIGQPSPDTPHSLIMDTPQGQLTCELLAVDGLACQFLYLTLGTDQLAAACTDTLKQLGEQLAEKLTYLLEPINSLEFDEEGVVLQMRSNPPRRDELGVEFYELLARRTGLRLSRCRKRNSDGQREIIPATVTHEVLGRLAADLDQAVEAFARN